MTLLKVDQKVRDGKNVDWGRGVGYICGLLLVY